MAVLLSFTLACAPASALAQGATTPASASTAAPASASTPPAVPAPDSFEKTSIALRTALHYDPAVDVPLQKLAALYRDAGRMDELLSLYAAHIAQYPEDGNAKLVLARLYAELKDRRAAEFLKAAIAQHPEHALLAWEQGRQLLAQHDPKAVEEMARAVSLEKGSSRRALWYGELLKAASTQGREDLVLTQTRKLMEEGAMNPEQRLRWARQAISVKLARTAGLLMQGMKVEALGGDSAVEAAMLQAQVQAADGNATTATETLDKLLSKLAPDHWRHREILMLRLDLAGKDGREPFVEQARAKWQQKDTRSAADALTFADVLEAAHRGGEALKILREASAQFPEAALVETRLLEVWEKQGTDAEALAWLDALLKKQPAREDLLLRRVRWLFASNQAEAARKGFATLLEKLDARQQTERSVELARWLRRRNQLVDAAGLLETALQKDAQRWDLRRELGEIYFAQRRKDDAAALFAGSWSKDLPPDALLEVAQFLMVKQLWLEAKGLIEP